MATKRMLSRTEWQMMNICWRLGRATAREVYETSLKDRQRDYQTVKTILDRIVVKGHLSVEKMGPLCLYEPLRGRQETLAEAIEDFVDVVLDRAPQPLVAYLAEHEDLDESDRQHLREILANGDSNGQPDG